MADETSSPSDAQSSAQDAPPSTTAHPLGEPLVELRDVNKHFGNMHVLRDIHLTVRRGEELVDIGPTGPGRSTLRRAINRPESIESREIRVDGELVSHACKS